MASTVEDMLLDSMPTDSMPLHSTHKESGSQAGSRMMACRQLPGVISKRSGCASVASSPPRVLRKRASLPACCRWMSRSRHRCAQFEFADWWLLSGGGAGRQFGVGSAQPPSQADRSADVRMPGYRFPRRKRQGRLVSARPRGARGQKTAVSVVGACALPPAPCLRQAGCGAVGNHDQAIVDGIASFCV